MMSTLRVPLEDVTNKKRKSQPEKWKRNIAKKLRQSGDSYKNAAGKMVDKVQIKPPCHKNCPKHCTDNISAEQRNIIFENFWKLDDSQKRGFYNYNITEFNTDSSLVGKIKERKVFREYSFTVDGIRLKVCQTFFANTLGICKGRIDYFFKEKSKDANAVYGTRHGKFPKKMLSNDVVDEVVNHINSFPRLPSHYSRKETSKEFLEPGINLNVMYNLFLNQSDTYVCYNTYAKIFEEKFNISFFIPKKDICPDCSTLNDTKIPDSDKTKEMIHFDSKEQCKAEKENDKADCSEDEILISVDMANIFMVPKTNYGPMFYKRKLTIFNFTARVNCYKTYFVTWDESVSGRRGDDLGSAYLKLLKQIRIDFPYATKYTIWSDSCVSQNKNQMVSAALLFFMKQNPDITEIQQKYSEAHHSLVQEVDVIHSKIEEKTRNIDIFSPIDYVAQLEKINSSNIPVKTIVMQKSDFFLFQSTFSYLNFSVIPYKDVKQIIYNGSLLIKIRCNFHDEFTTKCLAKQSKTRTKPNMKSSSSTITTSLISKNKNESIPKAKMEDLKYAFKHMTAVHVKYYENIFKNSV